MALRAPGMATRTPQTSIDWETGRGKKATNNKNQTRQTISVLGTAYPAV